MQRLEVAEGDLEAIKSFNDRNNTESDRLNTEITTLQRANAEYKVEVSNLTALAESLKSQVTTNESLLRDSQQLVLRLRGEVDAANAEAHNAREEAQRHKRLQERLQDEHSRDMSNKNHLVDISMFFNEMVSRPTSKRP